MDVNKGTRAKLEAFRQLIESFRDQVATADAFELGQDIIRRSGIINDVYQDRTPENLSRQENIEELVNGIHDFCDSRREEGGEPAGLTDFLSEVSLLSDQDADDSEDDDKVTLMTIHSAKGLEFHTVFVVGLEEDLFPSALAKNSMRELEEERRLFYVAITRAEKHCFLSFARSRFRYGHMEFGNPSCFLRDIDADCLDMPGGAGQAFPGRSAGRERKPVTAREGRVRLFEPAGGERRKASSVASPAFRKVKTDNPSSDSPSSGSAETFGLRVGQTIVHERFGEGEVERIDGTGENCKATVRFCNAGVKQLLLKFARFKVLDK